MNKIVSRAIIIFCAAFMAVAAFAGGSNPGLYYGQVPTAAQWNSYFAAKLDYTPGAANTIPYWDGSGNLLNAAISGDCTSAANVMTCTASHATSLSGGTVGAIPYQSAVGVTAFLSGNTTTTPQFVTSTGTGTAAQAPTLTSSTGTGSVVLATNPTFGTGANFPGVFAGAYTDGTVVDYTSGQGRISVGAADTLGLYTGGVANTLMATVAASGVTAPSFASTVTTGPNFTATTSSGVGVTQTIGASANAGTVGYGLTFNNTQTSVIEGVQVDMGSSAQAHDAFLAKGSNAAAADAFMASMQTGFTGNLFHGAVNNIDQYRVDASGNSIQAGLFTQGDATAPAGITSGGGMFSTNTAAALGLAVRKSTSGINASIIGFLKSRGTNASPTAVTSGDNVGNLSGYAFDGTNYLNTGYLLFSTEGTISTGIVPGTLSLATANASGVVTPALKIDSSQNVLVTGPGGLGYGTGSGGTVTQATSITSSVTLNKASGDITLFSSTRTAGQVTSFVLNDSLIGVNDTLALNVKSSPGSNAYFLSNSTMTAGSAVIAVYTPIAVTVADAPTIHFQLIKGSIN